MIARKADSQVGADDLAVIDLQFMAGAAVHQIDGEVLPPVVAPRRVVEPLDGVDDRVDVVRNRLEPRVVLGGVFFRRCQQFDDAAE